jgi:hypothetical protein
MGPVLLKILPFALGTIAPTMIGLVVLFLTNARGLLKHSHLFLANTYSMYFGAWYASI